MDTETSIDAVMPGVDDAMADDEGAPAQPNGGRDTKRRHRRFHRLIVVQTGRLDRDRVIVSTRDAAEVLLRDWPLPESKKRARAMELCLAVIRGEKPPHVARKAFVEAAREARVLLEE